MNSRYEMYVDNDGVSIMDEETKERVAGPLKYDEATRLVAKMNRPQGRRMRLPKPELTLVLTTVASHSSVLLAVTIWAMFIMAWVWFGWSVHFWHM